MLTPLLGPRAADTPPKGYVLPAEAAITAGRERTTGGMNASGRDNITVALVDFRADGS
ncbi:hypothetical protein [Amycolatopsis sp. cmx-4-61]|uniref:hypothetical protein n=1 Tax=Amycolatopsis sp. cmx-4-61 TaxID=2790937 RepID=UPI00397AB71D